MKQSADYAEALTPPLSWWVMGAGAVVSVFWCFLVATPFPAAVVAGLVAALVVGSILARTVVRVTTDDDGLRAGSAFLPWRHLGDVQILDVDETRRLLGVDADATAYLVVRAYCRTAVKVSVEDDRDPTPYWLVSTRHPDRLALHLRPRSMRD